MNLALEEARKAFQREEVPVGAVLVRGEEVLGKAGNLREREQSPLAHAELLALEEASRKLNSWRLEDCRLYVSLEPCLMCMGAIIQARISQLIYGCPDPKGGFSSFYNLDKEKSWTHKIQIRSGLCAEESSSLLKDFFQKLRN